MASQGVPIFPVIVIGTGVMLAWSGLNNKPVTDILRTLATGATPQPGPPESYLASTAPPGSTAAGGTPVGDTGASTATATANQAIARVLAAPYGWAAGTEWSDLVSLWNQESGWSNTAENPSSGAYGIPQANPPTKMPAAAQAPGSSASAQISWGLSYIKSTYGDPIAAWAHETEYGWY